MTKKDFLHSAISGAAGTAAQWLLMGGRHWLGILPGFEPYDALQSFLIRTVGVALPPGMVWALTFINGALIWSSIFSWAYDVIPGRTAVVKGAVVTVFAWLVVGLGIFPLIGLGVFAREAEAGARPAVLMLVMLTAYCMTLSFVYARLRRGR